MEFVLNRFLHAYGSGSGRDLADSISPLAAGSADIRRAVEYQPWITAVDIRQRLSVLTDQRPLFTKTESSAWADVYAAYWIALVELVKVEQKQDSSPQRVYDSWKEVALALIKGYSSNTFAAWTVPCLYVAGRFLRTFAQHADEAEPTVQKVTYESNMKDDVASDTTKNERLEDAARMINRIFTICISDRAPIEESRKWALYYITNLLFKTYFKLNSVSLSKNIIRALQASSNDMPPMEAFPKSHIVTFKYYVGVICFLEENYEMAEEHLAHAWRDCHKDAIRNKELILTYLIPCRMLTSHTLPSAQLLAPYPRLQALFGQLCKCVRKGDLAGYDEAMMAGEEEFVKRRVYLTLERGRDITLRNLLRKVYIAGGFEPPKDSGPPIRRTRVPVAEFAAALQLGTRTEKGQMDDDDVQCILANLIYKNLMKGYISRERGIVVLSKGSAFPGTGV